MVLEKLNVFSVNTNLGQVSMIANDMSEELAVIQWKKCLVLVSVHYVVLKHFCVNLIDSF